MELGNKMKALRLKAGLTQKKLAEELNVSFQTISKWENNVCAPDVMLLPKIAVFFGVTIDELFALSVGQKLRRIENMLDMEKELSHDTFSETLEFLKEQLESNEDKGRTYSFLAHLYHHRMTSDSMYVEQYVKKALTISPEICDCQWLLQMACGAAKRDFNVYNRNEVIEFYKAVVQKNPDVSENYLHLLDNLIADNRTEEATAVLKKYKATEKSCEIRGLIYEARIAWAEHRDELAKQKYAELERTYGNCEQAMFELANFHAKTCQYDKAITYYEKSFKLAQKPRYIDALIGIEICYAIEENYEEAVRCCDRELAVLREDFGFEEGEPIRDINERKRRYIEKIRG
ncbi:MAG: helix-turn-helix domain-containing protein [Lachnospiraceae bacterium]|nr:helix-turn-helix domain-containing protein [Lachnospiraceae bacterium]